MSDEAPTSKIATELRDYADLEEDDRHYSGASLIRTAAARLEALQAQVDAVRELHRPERSGGYRYCAECESGESAAPWPCATIRALGGDD